MKVWIAKAKGLDLYVANEYSMPLVPDINCALHWREKPLCGMLIRGDKAVWNMSIHGRGLFGEPKFSHVYYGEESDVEYILVNLTLEIIDEDAD